MCLKNSFARHGIYLSHELATMTYLLRTCAPTCGNWPIPASRLMEATMRLWNCAGYGLRIRLRRCLPRGARLKNSNVAFKTFFYLDLRFLTDTFFLARYSTNAGFTCRKKLLKDYKI